MIHQKNKHHQQANECLIVTVTEKKFSCSLRPISQIFIPFHLNVSFPFFSFLFISYLFLSICGQIESLLQLLNGFLIFFCSFSSPFAVRFVNYSCFVAGYSAVFRGVLRGG